MGKKTSNNNERKGNTEPWKRKVGRKEGRGSSGDSLSCYLTYPHSLLLTDCLSSSTSLNPSQTFPSILKGTKEGEEEGEQRK